MSEQYPGGFINKTAPTLNPALGNAAPGVWNMTQVQQAIKAGTWPAYDPYYKNVVLNLHGDGTNGAQNNTFLDSSTNNFTITRNGNTTQGTFTPYGFNWSNYFDGTGDYLTVPSNAAFNFSTGDFTVECWINLSASQTDRQIIGSADPYFGNGGWNLVMLNTGLNVDGNGNSQASFNYTWQYGVWYHVAVSRTGSNLYAYINGVSLGVNTITGNNTIRNSFSSTNGPVYVGCHPSYTNYGLNGYISNARIVTGTGLYPNGTTFTPSTTPLTAITNTSLLTCQSNRFIDNSTNNFTITKNGDTSVQRFSPFSTPYSTSVIGGSGYFDGNGDYLTIPANAIFRQDQGDWTLEGWFYVTSFATNCCFFSMGAMTSIDNFTAYSTTTGKVGYEAGTGGWAATANYETSANTISLNTWNHIAWVRSSGSLFIYVNGTRLLNQASAAFGVNSNNLLYIGDYFGQATSNAAPHYQCDVRFVKGTALYTGATLTVPTAPLTSVTNTSYLLNYTNAGILDNAMMNDLETVGNAQISTSVKKYGTGSMYFDGTGDGLQAVGTPNTVFGTGDFTVEFWINLAANLGNYVKIVEMGLTGACFTIETQSTLNTLNVTDLNTTVFLTSSSALTTGTWIHVAVTRASGTLRIFQNGTQTGSVANSTNFANSGSVYIGQSNSGQAMNGYIDDLRITKGYARYTASFTPPTSQLQDQ